MANQMQVESPPARPFNVFSMLLVIGIIGLAVAAVFYFRLPVGSTINRETINQPLNGATRAVVEIKVGAARLNLNAQSASTNLISGQVETLAGIETLQQNAQTQGSTLVYRLLAQRPAAVREPPQWPEWRLLLNTAVPTQLSVSGGIGTVVLNLRNLNLTELSISTDVSRYDVTLPERGQLRADITGGVSNTEVMIPKSMAVRAQVNWGGAGEVQVFGRSYGLGGSYTSPGFEQAKNRVELTLTGGSSRIAVTQVE